MRLKSLYYAQLPGRKNDALRMGYYLIEKVSRVEIKMNKQNAFASAYWHPSEVSFQACFAVRINLSTLTNRVSEGPKALRNSNASIKGCQISFRLKSSSNTLSFTRLSLIRHPFCFSKVVSTYKLLYLL